MAESIQRFLEETLPELQTWERRGLISKPELKNLVKKRREHEYAVRSRRATKVDFVRYLQYELNLFALIATRKKRLGVKKQRRVDFANVRRIHSLFQRTIRKYPDDVSLWLKYVEFGRRVNSTRVLGRVFARAVQVHTREPSLWIASAQFYAETDNVPTARLLLQRALRFCPRDEELWREYFRLEQRVGNSMCVAGVALEEASRIPLIVYRHSLRAFPGNALFHCSFLKLLGKGELDRFLAKGVIKDMTELYAKDADGLRLLWEGVFSSLDEDEDGGIESAAKNAASSLVAVAKTGSAKNQTIAFRLLSDLAKSCRNDNAKKVMFDALDVIFEFAERTVEIIVARLDHLMGVVSDEAWEEARTIAEAGTKTFTSSPLMWRKRLDVEFCLRSDGSRKSVWNAFASAESALSRCPDNDILRSIRRDRTCFAQLHGKESGINVSDEDILSWLRSNAQKSVEDLVDLLRFSFLAFDVHRLRIEADRILSASSPLEAFTIVIDAESSQPQINVRRIRTAFELAIQGALAKTEVALWRRYIDFETSLGELQRANEIRWKAERCLIDSRPLSAP